MTDGEAWAAFCLWQTSDRANRMIRFAFDADDGVPTVEVKYWFGHEPKPRIVTGDTLVDCWKSFEKLPLPEQQSQMVFA